MSGLKGALPDLQPAAPHDAVPGSWRPARGESALVRLTDGTWASLAVNGWGRDKRGRWCVELSWGRAALQSQHGSCSTRAGSCQP